MQPKEPWNVVHPPFPPQHTSNKYVLTYVHLGREHDLMISPRKHIISRHNVHTTTYVGMRTSTGEEGGLRVLRTRNWYLK